ncbi:MAG TPA: NAD+ synthase [Syntrophomonadaceae bacterium]|nr:NAD+ synthase [Syntrophomonadaceae bacterium]
MKITVAQFNPVVGDIRHNLEMMSKALDTAHQEGSDLLVFPELYLVGYPPRDLLQMPWFIEEIDQAVDQVLTLSSHYPETGILFGLPRPSTCTGTGLYNSALLIQAGKIVGSQDKTLLPTYDVFDETRYFDSAGPVAVIPFKDQLLGISICEDAWNDPEFWPRQVYTRDPISELADQGATLLINLSASPFQVGKEEMRYHLLAGHARRHRLPFIYVNQIGANDELIFDGCSMMLDRMGQALWVGKPFCEELKTLDLQTSLAGYDFTPQDKTESLYQALTLGIHDYMAKSGFRKAVLGLSGGIDSAITACLAASAVGPENVLGISMPSPYSSTGSVEDSRQLAKNLGIGFDVLPISEVFSTYRELLIPHWPAGDEGLAAENIQARIRGNLLMAFSNRLGYLVLSTGNKSEMAVGYCTLYGDMSGGLSVLSDVPKFMVYELAHFINKNQTLIPEEIIAKPPSAELRPGQLDQDSLPPYEILDQILYFYIEQNLSTEQLAARGFDEDTVKWVVRQVDRNEYKRRQAALGLKVSSKAFGWGRRMPIAAHWEHKFPH